jgi:hypothetical protein
MFAHTQVRHAAGHSLHLWQANVLRRTGEKDRDIAFQFEALAHIRWRIDEQQLIARWLQCGQRRKRGASKDEERMLGRLAFAEEF